MSIQKQFFTTALAVMLLGVTACSKKAQQRTLDGQIFIVTRGGNSVKLGLVPVSVYSEADVRLAVRVAAQKRASAATAAGNRLAELSEIRRQKWGFTDHMTEWDRISAENRAFADSPTGYSQVETERANLRNRLIEATSGHFAYSDLPQPIASTKTDADGRFALELPRVGRFAVAAHASREIGDSREQFDWFMWIDQHTPAGLMLSNDNTSARPDVARLSEPQ